MCTLLTIATEKRTPNSWWPMRNHVGQLPTWKFSWVYKRHCHKCLSSPTWKYCAAKVTFLKEHLSSLAFRNCLTLSPGGSDISHRHTRRGNLGGLRQQWDQGQTSHLIRAPPPWLLNKQINGARSRGDRWDGWREYGWGWGVPRRGPPVDSGRDGGGRVEGYAGDTGEAEKVRVKS